MKPAPGAVFTKLKFMTSLPKEVLNKGSFVEKSNQYGYSNGKVSLTTLLTKAPLYFPKGMSCIFFGISYLIQD